jgi:hypothetical protein
MRSFPTRGCESSGALQVQDDFVLFGGVQDVRSGLAVPSKKKHLERQPKRVITQLTRDIYRQRE